MKRCPRLLGASSRERWTMTESTYSVPSDNDGVTSKGTRGRGAGRAPGMRQGLRDGGILGSELEAVMEQVL